MSDRSVFLIEYPQDADILVYYDGPIYFAAQSNNIWYLFLALNDDDRDGHGYYPYFFVETTKDIINGVSDNKITLMESVLLSSKWYWTSCLNFSEPTYAQEVNVETIEDEWMPPDMYLNP